MPIQFTFREPGAPRYEQLAQAIENAIHAGELKPGDRLPPVRELAAEAGVSLTTVTAAFEVLSQRNLIYAHVGRGTFVAVTGRSEASRPIRRSGGSGWRRRLLMNLGARLQGLHPGAMDCSTGRPDVALLPVKVVRRALASVARKVTAEELQYAGPEAVEPLARVLVPLLEKDGIEAGAENLLIGSSAQQLMMLSLEVASRGRETAVAVEEPGYPTIMDAFERAGARLVGVAVDEEGAVPDSLEAALAAGAGMALLTPAAHNPTGASWSPQRRAALAAVLARHPQVVAVEDDQFAGIANARPGSLLSDERLPVIYIRSFSKSIGPDLRIAAAVTRPRLRALLAEAKSFADGWTSRMMQKTLAAILADEELPGLLARAREAYGERRRRAAAALNGVLRAHQGSTWCGPDGLNLWVHLPPGLESAVVIERAAAAGVRVAPGEAFFLHPGHGEALPLQAGSGAAGRAAVAGRLAAEAALASRSKEHGPIYV